MGLGLGSASRIGRSILSVVQLSAIQGGTASLFAAYSSSISTSILVILVTPIYLYRAKSKSPSLPKALTWPIVNTFGILFTVQLLCVIFRDDTANDPNTSLAIADGHLSLAGTICAGTLTYTMHIYSFQLAMLVNTYLISSTCSDIWKEIAYVKHPDLRSSGLLSAVAVLLKLAIFALVQLSQNRLQQHKGQREAAIKGFWDRSNFLWLNLTLVFRFTNVTRVNDLIDPGPSFSSELLYKRFIPHWQKEAHRSNYALAFACLRTLRWEFATTFIPRSCYICFRFAQVWLVMHVINTVQQGVIGLATFRNLLVSTIIVYFGMAISRVYFNHLNNHLITYTRSILVTAMFQKTLNTGHLPLKELPSAAVMGKNVDEVERIFVEFHDSWAGLVELTIAIYILANINGKGAFLGLFLLLAITVTLTYSSNKMINVRACWAAKMEERVAATADVLMQLKSIKMTGLSHVVSQMLQKKRAEEIILSLKERRIRVIAHFLHSISNVAVPVVIVISSAIYGKGSHWLNFSGVFSSLAVVAMVLEPLSHTMINIPVLACSVDGFSRIQDYLLQEDLFESRYIAEDDAAGNSHGFTYAIEVEDVQIARPDIDRPVIRDSSLRGRKGEAIMIYGRAGCGKSTLLKAILGEFALNKGRIRLASKRIAYCGQSTWLQNISIRDTILGQSEYIPSRYRDVVYCCALNEDFSQLPQGHNTLLGNLGSSISGGQQQRVALARAIYNCAPLLVLDDALSAVDLTTTNIILDRMFRKDSIIHQFKTSVIISATTAYDLSTAHTVYFLDEAGKLHKESTTQSDCPQTVQHSSDSSRQIIIDARTESWPPITEATGTPELDTSTLEWQRGGTSLYRYYLRHMALTPLMIWVCITVLAGVVEKLPQIFVCFWIGSGFNEFKYLNQAAVLSLCYASLVSIMMIVYYFVLVPTAADSMHSSLVKTVMQATVSFISESNSGFILARFGEDMDVVGNTLPKAFIESAFIGVIVVMVIGIISSGARYATVIALFSAIILFFVQHSYLKACRQMRWLDLKASAPLLTHIVETSKGVAHVRAFSWQDDFLWQFYGLLDYSQKPRYYMLVLQQWVVFIMDLSVCIIAVILVCLGLAFHDVLPTTAIGLAMVNLTTLNPLLQEFMSAWSDLDGALVAISSTKAFNSSTPTESEVGKLPAAELPNSWPLRGEISLNSVSARYNSSGPRSAIVLKNISYTIEPRQKIAVIGRTGSGKTSLILSILNLLEHTGTITIDGTDIQNVEKSFLRSRIITIPQDGLELSASLRVNLDPTSEHDCSRKVTDEALENVLKRVGLFDAVQGRGGLDVALGRIMLSPVQKQLLCLARAVVARESTQSRIVLIDEATNSIDAIHYKQLQSIIAREFTECTVISVTHHRDGVGFADMVLEMSDGKITRVLNRHTKEIQDFA